MNRISHYEISRQKCLIFNPIVTKLKILIQVRCFFYTRAFRYTSPAQPLPLARRAAGTHYGIGTTIDMVLPARRQMAFRAHPPRSINLSTLIRCRNSSRPSKAETPGGLLPPGADKAKPKTSVIVESTGLVAPKKIATVSSKDIDSQARDQRQPALAYPPEHYFDTHQTVMKLRALGQL